MKKALRICSSVFFAVIMIACSAFPVLADTQSPEEYNKNVTEKILELEKKYSIVITYPKFTTGYAPIGTASLATLDQSLEYITPEIVRQVSNYYYKKNGRVLRFVYTYSEDLSSQNNNPVLAAFDSTKSQIEIYIPHPGNSAIITGCSPIALIHEFGHALHQMYYESHGYDKMQSDWLSFNRGISYHPSYIGKNPGSQIFVSGYAATDYEEDFAETFAYAFVCNRAGLGLRPQLVDNSGNWTALGQKINYIEHLLPQFLENTDSAVANIQKAYSAEVAISYKQARLSGSYLEYIGFNQPNAVLDAILAALEFDKSSCTINWVREIGGWEVENSSGGFILFPSGVWGRLYQNDPAQQAA